MCDNADVSDFLYLIGGFGGKNGLGNRFAEPGLPFEFDFFSDGGKFVKVFYKF